MTEPAYRVHICHGPNCTPRGGAKALIEALEAEVRRLGIEDRVEILATSCRNRCELGPSVNVYPGPVCYGHVTLTAITQIAREHLRDGVPVIEYIVADEPRPIIDFSKLDKLF
ncbi:MAG: (2Fe-2S) ferredoxin domain-containing protein [Thermomicrobiales bacterium]|nr:(2Fe-2S) ferredoxin domain-containing protein [Thermomicrobiales bacterium]